MKRGWLAGMWWCAAAMGVWAAGAQAPQKAATSPAVPAEQLKGRVGTPDHPFPTVDPRNFTASQPTAELVNTYLTKLWGYNPNRVWSVAAIQKTQAPGVARIVVFLADKRQPGKVQRSVFFTTPDGAHVIAEQVLPFGADPFAESRKLMQDEAKGPAQGAPGKNLLVVEFAGEQCVNCAAAHEKVVQLMQDFPEARFVFEDLPIAEVSPQGARAAAVGVCVRNAKGDAGFFAYLKYMYDHQSVLTAASAEATLKLAVQAAGADATVAMACADTQKAKEGVAGPVNLAMEAGIEGEPMISINGRMVGTGGVDYETLKAILIYQAGLDGVKVRVQPTLTALP